MNNETEQIFLINTAEAQPSSSTQKTVIEVPESPQVNLDNVQDFSNVCRTCATITEYVIPIFGDDGHQNNLAEKIQKHLPIQVSTADVLPLVVCYQCASTLLAWHELVQCCLQADAALRARIARDNHQDPKTSAKSNITTTEEEAQNKDACIVEDDSYSSEHSDDEPLATLVSRKASTHYTNLYNALLNLRNHLDSDHKTEETYPDFTDSSQSETENIDNFDDLTHCNMRKDRMDDETRKELSEVQKKINGKVFYVCKICGKSLSSSHTYVFHKRIHTGERPCICHICGKQFRAPNGLQRHLTETHEKLKRYYCNYCTKTFANSQNLKQHMRIHTGERPFVCSQCGKRFTQSGSLHVHLKTHSEQFPHVCAECGAKFRIRSGLARHRLKHTGERPHACHCGRAFRHQHELKAHAWCHSGARPFTCTTCGATFRQKRALRHHSKRNHEAELTVQAQPAYCNVGYTT